VRGQADVINIHSFLIIFIVHRSHALVVPAVLESSAPTEGIFMVTTQMCQISQYNLTGQHLIYTNHIC